MNDEAPIPRSETDSWDANREVREELQALLAELESRLEAKESRWRLAGLIPARGIDEPLAHARPSR